jgi:cell division protein FtsW
MGARTQMTQNTQQMATPKQSAQSRKPIHVRVDVPLVLITVTLAIFGSLMIYSASSDFSFQVFGSGTYIFERQLMWLGLGIVSATVVAMLDYHNWRKFAIFVMIGAIILLLLVLILQDERLGAVRSIFKGSIQPSELAKLVLVIYLAVWLDNRRDELKKINIGLFPLGIILGLIGAFIIAQPDLSAFITVVLLGVMMFFLAGGDWKQFIFVMGLGVIVGWLVLQSGLFPTGTERMNSFLVGIRDPMQYSEHVRRSLEAFAKGGWFGVGIGKSETKLFGLPFPHTDSVFAVVGEETGLIGAMFLVALFVGLVWRGLVIAHKAPDDLGRLLAGGLAFWLALEGFINMAVMVGLMPFAGNALPFISAGGSSLVVTLVGIGIILNVSRLSEITKEEEEKTFSAVVNLRRRNGRRRVSRTRRSTSA